MAEKYRESEFIDFNTGTVKLAPMQLQFRMALAGPLQFDDLVRVFQCRIEVWNLGVAVAMLHQIEFNTPPSVWSHAAYALLSVVFSYFEMIGKTLNPTSTQSGTAAVDFNYGFCDVYPEYAPAGGDYRDANLPLVSEFRNRARNGLYHLGSTKQGLWVHNNPNISTKDFDLIHKVPDDPTSAKYYVNPHALTRTVVAHFPSLIDRLKNPAPQYDAMRAKFGDFLADFHVA